MAYNEPDDVTAIVNCCNAPPEICADAASDAQLIAKDSTCKAKASKSSKASKVKSSKAPKVKSSKDAIAEVATGPVDPDYEDLLETFEEEEAIIDSFPSMSMKGLDTSMDYSDNKKIDFVENPADDQE